MRFLTLTAISVALIAFYSQSVFAAPVNSGGSLHELRVLSKRTSADPTFSTAVEPPSNPAAGGGATANKPPLDSTVGVPAETQENQTAMGASFPPGGVLRGIPGGNIAQSAAGIVTNEVNPFVILDLSNNLSPGISPGLITVVNPV